MNSAFKEEKKNPFLKGLVLFPELSRSQKPWPVKSTGAAGAEHFKSSYSFSHFHVYNQNDNITSWNFPRNLSLRRISLKAGFLTEWDDCGVEQLNFTPTYFLALSRLQGKPRPLSWVCVCVHPPLLSTQGCSFPEESVLANSSSNLQAWSSCSHFLTELPISHPHIYFLTVTLSWEKGSGANS